VPSFDTLTYAKKLQEAGFTPRQAEAQAEALRGVLEENIATQQHLKDTEDSLKRDIKELETSLKRDMKELETSLKRDMKELEASLKRDMKELEASLKRDMKEIEANLKRDMKELEGRLTQQIELIRKDMEVMRRDIIIWLGGLIVVSITALGILMKLL
jgi:predicted phage-related endonuclease